MDDDHNFVVWDLLELRSLPGGVNGLPNIHHGPKVVRRPNHEDRGLPAFSTTSMSSWQRHRQGYLAYIIAEDENQDYRLFLYSIQQVGRCDTAFLPAHIPVAGGQSQFILEDLGEPITNPVSPIFLCDDWLVMCSRTNADELIATILPVPIEALEDMTIYPSSAILVNEGGDDADSLWDYNVGFYPMSGRVVYHASDTCLHILDFLLPLGE